MTVHASAEKIAVETMAFEVRYDDGFRYLDHCGEALSRIRRYDKSWIYNSAAPMSGSMLNSKENLILTFGIHQLNVAVNGEVPVSKGEQKAHDLGVHGQALYELIVEAIKVTESTRIGVRYRFAAPADTLEDADLFLNRKATSPILDVVLKSTKSVLRESSTNCVVEDLESGYKRRVVVQNHVTRKVNEPVYTGLEYNGAASVVIDIDTFTRPENGHFQKSNLFIQNNYNRSRAIAFELFDWFRTQR